MQRLHRQGASLLFFTGRFGVAGRDDGFTKLVVELTFGAEESRHEEVEEGPEFQDVVLDGCAGEDQAVHGLDAFHGFGEFGFGGF